MSGTKETTVIGIFVGEDDRTHFVKIPMDLVVATTRQAIRHAHRYGAIIIGFEDSRGRFEVYREVGSALNGLFDQFKSIFQSEDRTYWQFGDENEFLLFRMLWENP